MRVARRANPRRPTDPLLFADVFALTAVAPNGKVRSKRPPFGFRAFDAKPPRMLVCSAGLVAQVVDDSLRPVSELTATPTALLAGGACLTVGRLDDATAVSVDARAPVAAPDPPVLHLDLGPPRGEREWGPPPPPAVSPDGGVALPWGDRALRLGHVDESTGAFALHAEVRVAVSAGTRRVSLPGRDHHVLAALDVAGDVLHLAVIGADGTVARHLRSAVGLPARGGDSLWWQRDDRTVTGVTLDGDELGAWEIPDEHRGVGTVFVQGGAAWFVPWHGEVVVGAGRVIDRRLPGDAVARRHVADLLRRARAAGRSAGLSIELQKLHTSGRTKPVVQFMLTHDGGDLGPLAHSVAGAMIGWPRWRPLPDFTVYPSTGAWVIAARTAGAPELLDALSTLDAHGFPLRAAAPHWDQIYGFGAVAPFRDDASDAFLGALLSEGPLRPAGERALASPPSVDELAASLARLHAAGELTPPLESLVNRVLARHRAPDVPAVAAALAARTPLKRLALRRW